MRIAIPIFLPVYREADFTRQCLSTESIVSQPRWVRILRQVKKIGFFKKTLRIIDRMGRWCLLRTMWGFSIFLRDDLVIRSPILFTSGISEFGPDSNLTGKRSHLHNFVLPGCNLGQAEVYPFKVGLGMQITAVELPYRQVPFLVSGKKPKIQILKEVWRWEFFAYKKNPSHSKQRSVF